MTNATPGPPAPPPEPAGRRPLLARPGDALLLLGASTVIIFSFAPFVSYSPRARENLFMFAPEVSPDFNAWSLQTFMVPLTTFVVVAALLLVAAAAARVWLGRDPRLLGFRLRQLEVGLAMFAFLVLLGLVASDKHAVFGARRIAELDPTFDPADSALDTGWGAVLMLVGAVLALVGAVLNHFSVGPAVRLAGGRRAGRAEPEPPTGPEGST